MVNFYLLSLWSVSGQFGKSGVERSLVASFPACIWISTSLDVSFALRFAVYQALSAPGGWPRWVTSTLSLPSGFWLGLFHGKDWQVRLGYFLPWHPSSLWGHQCWHTDTYPARWPCPHSSLSDYLATSLTPCPFSPEYITLSIVVSRILLTLFINTPFLKFSNSSVSRCLCFLLEPKVVKQPCPWFAHFYLFHMRWL